MTKGFRVHHAAPTVFYFDLGSPYCWLVAEQLLGAGASVTWMPVLETLLNRQAGHSGWATSDVSDLGRQEVEEAAAALGLRLRWPDPWPADCSRAMRVAAYAFTRACTREFAIEAYRTEFLEGQSIGEWHALAGALLKTALNPREALDAPLQAFTKELLVETTSASIAAGVRSVPSVCADGRIYAGHEATAAALRAPGDLLRGALGRPLPQRDRDGRGESDRGRGQPEP